MLWIFSLLYTEISNFLLKRYAEDDAKRFYILSLIEYKKDDRLLYSLSKELEPEKYVDYINPDIATLIGMNLLFSKRYKKSAHYLGFAFIYKPKSVELLYYLGLSYFKAKEYTNAIPVFKNILNTKQTRIDTTELKFLIKYSYIKLKNYTLANKIDINPSKIAGTWFHPYLIEIQTILAYVFNKNLPDINQLPDTFPFLLFKWKIKAIENNFTFLELKKVEHTLPRYLVTYLYARDSLSKALKLSENITDEKKKFLIKAMIFEREKDIKKAINYYLKNFYLTKNEEVLNHIGFLLIVKKQYRQIIDISKKLDESPEPFIFLTGLAYYKIKKYSSAKQIFAKLYKESNDDITKNWSGYYLAYIYFKEQRFAKTLDILNNIHITDKEIKEKTLYIKAVSYTFIKEYNNAQKYLQKLVAITGNRYKKDTLKLKILEIKLKKSKDTIKIIDAFLKKNPRTIFYNKLIYQKSLYYYNNHFFIEALYNLNHLTPPLENNFSDDVVFLKGKIYIKLLNIPKAKELYSNYLSIKPASSVEIYWGLADIYVYEGKYKKAIKLLENGIKHVKNKIKKGKTYLKIAKIYKKLNMNNPMITALKQAEKYGDKKNTAPEAKIEIVDYFIAQGKLNDAYKRISEYISKFGSDSEILYRKGIYFIKTGKTKKGIESINRSIENIQNREKKAEIYTRAGILLLQANDKINGRIFLKKALSLTDNEELKLKIKSYLNVF